MLPVEEEAALLVVLCSEVDFLIRVVSGAETGSLQGLLTLVVDLAGFGRRASEWVGVFGAFSNEKTGVGGLELYRLIFDRTLDALADSAKFILCLVVVVALADREGSFFGTYSLAVVASE